MPVAPAAPLPSGTLTFAFTDIEGSTQRWDRDRDAMQAAVRRHDSLMRAAIGAHGGYVFKTIGDAFCAAFARPEDAVAAMLDVQRALAAEDFSAVDGVRVRAAIHTGTADERDGDYFGPTLNRVARLLAIGYGGQVLVSSVVAELVQGVLPAGAALRDLGAHRLKDLTRPEHVYQLLAPDLDGEFSPLRSLDARPNNLPQFLTPFIAREGELAAISALLARNRLVTIAGSGGVGKTRTASQVAAGLLDGFADGVWFIELAPLSSGEYLPTTVAQALRVRLPAEGDRLAQLLLALSEKSALLVFDNCEHMIQPAAHVVAAILRACPKVSVLATSRQPLEIAGEATFRLPSLVLPAADEAARMPASDLMRYAAVALFLERARAANGGFTLTDANAPIVADICRQLDGIPLAIELAASRIKMFSPAQVRDRLDERFRILTGGARDVLPRQQTLRALIDWSFDLLDERERALFRRLGIFVNGFALAGAGAVAGGEDLDEIDVFDVLGSLVDKSLVLAEPLADTMRYRLLESTRAYALEKLAAAGESTPLAIRHLRYFRDRFAEVRAQLEDTRDAKGREEALRTELEDVRAALDGALARADAAGGAELLADVGYAWRALGLDPEGIARCEAHLAALDSSDARLRARLLGLLSFLRAGAGQKARAFELATEAVCNARASGDASALGYGLRIYAMTAIALNKLTKAKAALDEAEAIPGTSTNLRLNLLETRGHLSTLQGDFNAAVQTHERLLAEHLQRGDARGALFAAVNLAEAEHARGETRRAIELSRRMLPEARTGTDKSTVGIWLENLAGYLVAVDDLAGAAEAAREAIAIFAAREPEHVYVRIAIEHLALVFVLRGDRARAARLEGYVAAAFRKQGYERVSTEAKTFNRLSALLRETFAPSELERLISEGGALETSSAIALALEAADEQSGAFSG